MKLLITLTILIGFLPLQASAQELGQNDAPIEISADNSLEWMQEDQQYIANGNVEVTQGDAKIYANKLIADYRENETTGATEIWQLTALENVRLINADTTATGNKAIYNIDTGLSVITGNNLKLTTPEQVITARDALEYNFDKGIAKAIGNAKIIQGQDTLSANTITANFSKDSKGKQALKTATANGGVTIKTSDETLTGNKAIYNATNNTAEVLGNVKIVRGPNILEGARAEVNLTTNLSKMFGNPNDGKRVKGIFFPSSKPQTTPTTDVQAQ